MESEPKLKESQKWLMLGVAIFFDATSAGINLIPVVGQVGSFFVGLFATMTFWLWFKLNGMSFSKPKNILGLVGGSVIEMIPILNVLPAWTATILYLTRVEKIVNKVTAPVNNIVSITQGKRPRINDSKEKEEKNMANVQNIVPFPTQGEKLEKKTGSSDAKKVA